MSVKVTSTTIGTSIFQLSFMKTQKDGEKALEIFVNAIKNDLIEDKVSFLNNFGTFYPIVLPSKDTLKNGNIPHKIESQMSITFLPSEKLINNLHKLNTTK